MNIVTKLSEAKGAPRSRIWLQGSRLPEHGFKLGSYFVKKWSAGKLELIALPSAPKEPSRDLGKVSGNSERPVIDIVGQKVAGTFKGTHVNARFQKGRIVITEAGQ